jgi:hypothetical protein
VDDPAQGRHRGGNFVKHCSDLGSARHVCGEGPTFHGFHLEGNISFCSRTGSNILTGGVKPISNVVLKDNCTYNPATRRHPTFGVDVGYVADGVHDIRIEGNYFMGCRYAMAVRGITRNVNVTGNTFWAPGEEVEVGFGRDADHSSMVWDRNTYFASDKFDLAASRKRTGFDQHSRLAETRGNRPTGLHVFGRVNKYEPDRVHLAVCNWDHRPSVTLGVSDLVQEGARYRIVNVLDFFGKPVTEGVLSGHTIDLPMEGHAYEPEFGAYILFRELPKQAPEPQKR